MARTTSVAENHQQLFPSSQTALTSRSLKNRIDFLLMTMANLTLFAQIFSFLPKENVDFAVAMANGGVVTSPWNEIDYLQLGDNIGGAIFADGENILSLCVRNLIILQ